VFNLRFQNHATVYYELDSLKLPLQIGEGRGEVKGGKKMTIFQRFMADLWFSLFFHVSASKFIKTLIVNYASETNGMQREFLFNNGIHSQRGVLSLRAAENPFLSLKPPAPKNKLFQTLLTCRDGILAVRWLGDDSH
jgi:hypothetical protein